MAKRSDRLQTPAGRRPAGREGISDAAPSPAPPPRRGRPRLTADDLRVRLADYCGRYDAVLNDEGLPPFPAGKRETAQHREWMSLYKAHRRLSDRGPDTTDLEQRQELLAAQHGRCGICRKPLDLEDSRLDPHETHPAVLHARCLDLVALARLLGAEALDRARNRI
jgi:hypothetical protein